MKWTKLVGSLLFALQLVVVDAGSFKQLWDDVYAIDNAEMFPNPNMPVPSDVWFAKCITNYHNEYRARAGLGELTWDDDLAEFAFNLTVQFNTNNGENLFTLKEYPKFQDTEKACHVAANATLDWWKELLCYNWSISGDWDECDKRCNKPIGHLTQMLWSSTTHLGCSWASCLSYNEVIPTLIVACEYSPRGNVQSRAAFDQDAFMMLNTDEEVVNDFGGLPSCP